MKEKTDQDREKEEDTSGLVSEEERTVPRGDIDAGMIKCGSFRASWQVVCGMLVAWAFFPGFLIGQSTCDLFADSGWRALNPFSAVSSLWRVRFNPWLQMLAPSTTQGASSALMAVGGMGLTAAGMAVGPGKVKYAVGWALQRYGQLQDVSVGGFYGDPLQPHTQCAQVPPTTPVRGVRGRAVYRRKSQGSDPEWTPTPGKWAGLSMRPGFRDVPQLPRAEPDRTPVQNIKNIYAYDGSCRASRSGRAREPFISISRRLHTPIQFGGGYVDWNRGPSAHSQGRKAIGGRILQDREDMTPLRCSSSAGDGSDWD